MHVADQVLVEAFEVQIGGERVGPEAVFPDWSRLDRFGIVVTEPLGGLGASLLLQLAIAKFYSVRPDRRAGMAVYPEIYLFHVGGPHGDFSYFDFWPPRKEVRVAASQPASLLEAINARGITSLAMPPGDMGADSVLQTGPSTWAEQASAMERLRSCFVYAPDGHAADSDVRISSRDPRVHENITASVTPLPEAIAFREELASVTLPRWPDPSVAADGYRWADVVERRVDEVPQPVRDHVAEALAARLRSGELVETYRRITTAEALAYIAGGFLATLPSERVVGLSLAAMSAALWALGGIAAQELFSRHHVDPGWLAGVRMACGGLLLLVGRLAPARPAYRADCMPHAPIRPESPSRLPPRRHSPSTCLVRRGWPATPVPGRRPPGA